MIAVQAAMEFWAASVFSQIGQKAAFVCARAGAARSGKSKPRINHGKFLIKICRFVLARIIRAIPKIISLSIGVESGQEAPAIVKLTDITALRTSILYQRRTLL